MVKDTSYQTDSCYMGSFPGNFNWLELTRHVNTTSIYFPSLINFLAKQVGYDG